MEIMTVSPGDKQFRDSIHHLQKSERDMEEVNMVSSFSQESILLSEKVSSNSWGTPLRKGYFEQLNCLWQIMLYGVPFQKYSKGLACTNMEVNMYTMAACAVWNTESNWSGKLIFWKESKMVNYPIFLALFPKRGYLVNMNISLVFIVICSDILFVITIITED